MNAETVILIVAATVLLTLVVVATLIGAVRAVQVWRGADTRADRPEAEFGAPVPSAGILFDRLAEDGSPGREPTYDRVFRIASWAFLLISTVIVAGSGMWRDALPQIVILVAVTGGFLLLIHDVFPVGVLRSARAILQALVALVFASLIVAQTGGFASPFVLIFPLIMGGAAIVVGPWAALGLALAAAGAYGLAATATSGLPTSIQLITTAVNLTVLFLLTYIGSAVGREQRRARQAALRLSALDSLTGLFNRTSFFSALEGEIARSERTGRGFCVLMLDVDLLKDVNDRYGHHAGDAVLRGVAEAVRTRVRKIDVASRYGGDEFAALLPETDPTGGWVVAEKIRLGVKDQPISGFDFRPTVSIGVVSYPPDGRTADALMISADRAMYASKRGGKDRVATPLTEPTAVPTEEQRTGPRGIQAG